jgi:hypothetical protein
MALGVLLLAVVIISAALIGNLNVVYIQGNDKTVSVGSKLGHKPCDA